MCTPRASASTSSGSAYSRSIRSLTWRNSRRSRRCCSEARVLVTSAIVRRTTGLLGEQRQREAERRPDPELALHPDPSPVTLHDRLGDRQPQSGAAQLAAVDLLHLVEALEDRLEFLCRDPASLVLDRDQDLVLPRDCTDLDGATVPGELQRVPEQV